MVARVANTEVCDSKQCRPVQLLVRADKVSFVSTEQVRRVGYHALDPDAMPSDIELPGNYVLVHDTAGELLNRCDFYIVRWYSDSGHFDHNRSSQKAVRDAKAYFGSGASIRVGSVDIPDGPWKRETKVKCIRYRRHGYDKLFEHTYEVPVHLFTTDKPLAWRVSLPDSCIVDERGFVRP
jgi:hypothetical protein